MKETLYARDSKGKILHWTIKSITTGMQTDIMKSYGELDGNSTIRWQRNIQGKNIDKANETSPAEQADLEIASQIKRKKDKGYMSLEDLGIAEFLKDKIPTIEDLSVLPKFRQTADGSVKPMLAQQYYKSKKNWTAPDGIIQAERKHYYMKNPYIDKEAGSITMKFPCMGQPKINGVRSTIELIDNEIVIKSKEGLRYRVAHIEDFLTLNSDLFNFEGTQLVLDGELYIHGEILGDIASAVNKPNLSTPRIVFVLFDLAIPDKTQRERWALLKALNQKFQENINAPIELIRSYNIASDPDAQILTDRFIDNGYEGLILRSYDALYRFGSRPTTMCKLKRTISEEFSIIDVVPQSKDHTKGNFTCINKAGEPFDVDPKGTDEYKRDLLLNKEDYKGKKVTLVFYEWTAAMMPYHIVECTLRNYE